MQIITKQDIQELNAIKDLSLKQRKINEYEYALYKNEAQLESLDMWDYFYEKIHKKTSFGDEIRLKAFSNVFEHQLQMLKIKHNTKSSKCK